MLGSFKHKLAVYFLLLAVAPLTAAFWGFGTVTKHAEERRADSRLEAELRAVFASYERQANHVEALARNLAGRRDVQRGLRLGSFGRLPRDVAVLGPHRLVVGLRGTIESTQTVRVKAGRRVTLLIGKNLVLETTPDAAKPTPAELDKVRAALASGAYLAK